MASSPPVPRLTDVLATLGLVGESWAAWRVVAKCLDGLPLDRAEQAVYEQCTERVRPPSEPPAEFYGIIGRRAGKSRFAGAAAVRAAAFVEYAARLAPGERAVIALAAADREQARGLLGYAVAPFREDAGLQGLVARRSAWRALQDLVARRTRWGIDLTTGATIEVRTANFGTIRGRSYALVVADELAFWQAEDGSNPASEVLTAVRPGLVTLGGQLIGISSPYARRGPLWDVYERYYGKDDAGVLVWKAPTRVMNPTVPERVVLDALERDEAAARAEWLAEFRLDVEGFVNRDAVMACVVAARRELAALADRRYVGFVDPAGGSGQDSTTLGIAHAEIRDGRTVAVLDCVRERKPPFSPEQVVGEFAETLKAYRVSAVTGDRFAGEYPREAFRKHGIQYVVAERTKSEIYRDVLPLINSGQVELLDHPRLIAQLVGLERHVARGGRDTIDHGPGGHDDVINAAAGALVMASAAPGALQIWSYITPSVIAPPGSAGWRELDPTMAPGFLDRFLRGE